MATTGTTIKTEELRIPYDVVKRSSGFSLDIGSSAAKLVYRDVIDWDGERNEPKQIEGGLSTVRLVSFPNDKINDVITHIQEHCKMTSEHKDEKPLIHATGLSCSRHKKDIEQELNIRLKILMEMDCFVKAFSFLSDHLLPSQFLHPHSEKGIQQAKENKLTLENWAQQISETKGGARMKEQEISKNVKITDPVEGEAMGKYPCLLGQMGSAFDIYKLPGDGTFTMAELSNRGGRMLLGLGSLLTGAQSYIDLIKLAEKGNSNNVHTFFGELQKEDLEEDPDEYGDYSSDHLVFCFGKAVNKSIADFRSEDLALAFIQTMCIDLTQHLDNALRLSGASVIYLCGGFVSHPLIRDIMTQTYLSRVMVRGETLDSLRFVKNGGFLGAIGAFMEEYTT